MELGLDTVSCRALRRGEEEIERWALVVVSGATVRELIVWGKGGNTLVGSEEGLSGSLRGVGWEGERLKLYFKDRQGLWDLRTGKAKVKPYASPAEAKGAEKIRMSAHGAAFRTRGKSMVVFINADTKMTRAVEVFRRQRERFQALPRYTRFMASWGPTVLSGASVGMVLLKTILLLLVTLAPVAVVMFFLTRLLSTVQAG